MKIAANGRRSTIQHTIRGEANMTIRAGGQAILIVFLVLLGAESRPRPASDGPKVELIGEGVISTPGDEFGGAMSPDGHSIYFCRSVPTSYLYVICVSHLDGHGQWSAPEVMPFSGQWRDSDPVLSPDGKTLLFASDRPVNGVDLHHFHIWRSALGAKGWSDPEMIPGRINEVDATQLFASMAANGTIYFTSGRNHKGRFDVFRSKLVDGRYGEPEPLPELSSGQSTTIEAFIAPDESYIILGSFGREDALGSSDLYISYNQNGHWSKPQNVGPGINSKARDYSPRVSPDGQYLIFASERGFPTDPHDQNMSYDDFIKGTHEILNGYGNIYRVPMSYVFETTRPH